MKSISLLLPLLSIPAFAGEIVDAVAPKEPVAPVEQPHSHLWDDHRVDSHAPLGVMLDHTHNAGEFMLSYRYMWMAMDGQRDGTSDLSSQDVFNRGFMVAPTEMEMEMHMFGLMYAPTDWLTLAAMGSYNNVWMDHVTRPGSMARMLRGESFRTEADGWGDLALNGLFKVWDNNHQRVHFHLGVSAPTGEFNELPYAMQYTSGTWDLLLGGTYLWQASSFSGGAQVRGRIHLDENKFDYTNGDQFIGTTWVAYQVVDWMSLSGRISLEYRDEVDGADNRITRIMSPAMSPFNQGGTWSEVGLGVNLYGRKGLVKGHRLAFEALLPIYQDLNGPQLQRDWAFVVGWQKAF